MGIFNRKNNKVDRRSGPGVKTLADVMVEKELAQERRVQERQAARREVQARRMPAVAKQGDADYTLAGLKANGLFNAHHRGHEDNPYPARAYSTAPAGTPRIEGVVEGELIDDDEPAF